MPEKWEEVFFISVGKDKITATPNLQNSPNEDELLHDPKKQED